MADVSVIIPNFNRETLIGDPLENQLAQTAPPHEIIVVDDGSTDKSVEVIRSFGSKIKLIEQTNQGPGAARNAGLSIATGEFIQFQDSDDLFSLNSLRRRQRPWKSRGRTSFSVHGSRSPLIKAMCGWRTASFSNGCRPGRPRCLVGNCADGWRYFRA